MARESRATSRQPNAIRRPHVYSLVVPRTEDQGDSEFSFELEEVLSVPSAAARPKDADSPDHLQALELISGAAQAMQMVESHSHKIQAKAFELLQHSRSKRIEASQQIASLQERLIASEANVEQLTKRLAEAEARANTAEHWLRRFHDAINTAFADKRACQPDKVSSAA
ncbi:MULTISPECIES: hypothetical protein [unclassified Bradyrhizobium]|uniref:hypothetical protein n=1 Tax=unclassified Bradyrhizobium TaxID=2631580 RepID=UPI001BA7F5AF|nr:MULTISPECIES: hypothetical protein [unclassified Bradyrhizobium]MBR1226170.1 hypothetical protein [Bradyrhizobium sp. AUGA SZCCT0176]MBR1295419.1 hypothetical protein [Bradyrhizobium sp. AUGA SZCCT0042]